MARAVLPLDHAARDVIASNYGETLFVEAGAGCGKTEALVGRVTKLLVSSDEVSVDDLAVITFTNKAASELRHRIRSRLEDLFINRSEPAELRRIKLSLEKLDGAAISTLHGFARRLLTEHSVEAGLPPSFEVLDEISSQVDFLARFENFLDSLLLDSSWSRTLLIGDALGINPAKHLLPMATKLHEIWDLLTLGVTRELEPIQFDELIANGRSLASKADTFISGSDSDSMTDALEVIRAFVQELESGFDDIQQVSALANVKVPSGKRRGRKENWVDIQSIRSEYEQYREQIASFRDQLADVVLRRLTTCVTNFVLDGVREQRNQGCLDYHDLLVSAREVLKDPHRGPLIRRKVHNQYKHLLIDEFQDTDPLQIEIATLIASPIDAQTSTSWQATPTLPGRLFFVGDPKQSIYRFRRASISLYLEAQDKYADGKVQLSTNFRSTPEIIDWINTVFGKLITPRLNSQPPYSELVSIRESAPLGNAVTVLGAEAHPKSDKSDVRSVEAHDITQTVIQAIREGWSVNDHDQWRKAKFSDIAVLVPTRSAMDNIQRDFERAGISYRLTSSNIVWRSREIRDLIMCLRAVNDPSDSLATVSALRSSIYGCGDDDLYRFRIAHPKAWDWAAKTAEQHAAQTKDGDPVAIGLAHLAELHAHRTTMTPSELMGQIIQDRQIEEQCAARRDPRESLRRIRYALDQARAWSDSDNGLLQRFLSWVDQQTMENARSVETILSEDDDDSVRLMTIHAAKGLEFPIAILAGLPLQARRENGVRVGYPPNAETPEVRISKDLQTGGFDNWAEAEQIFGHDESIRNLYVACTRACDHLVVSVHRKESPSSSDARTARYLLAEASQGVEQTEVDHSGGANLVSERQAKRTILRPDLTEWRNRYNQAIELSYRNRFISATHISQAVNSVNAVESVDPGLAKDASESELPIQGRGRYGTAIGRAVHAVLQTIDLKTGKGLTSLAVIHAEAEGISELSRDVESLVNSAIRSPELQQAIHNRYWRELHVACPMGDQIIEGYVDLVYETDGGLVVIDYKTDLIQQSEIEAKVDHYRLQGATYAVALEKATRLPVIQVSFAFLSTDSDAVFAPLPDLQGAIAEVHHVIEHEGAAGSRP
tara:strand:+ start:3014 stop:6361 length:3348 start_codon:yes stop_codon:yes gene_type:complete